MKKCSNTYFIFITKPDTDEGAYKSTKNLFQWLVDKVNMKSLFMTEFLQISVAKYFPESDVSLQFSVIFLSVCTIHVLLI